MTKIALLIGVSEYEPGLSPLPAAIKDLDAIREVLIDPEIGGFSDANVTLLKNADRQIVEEAIYALFSGRQRDDLLLLFFSGHGIKDDSGALYLATRTTRKLPQGDLITPTAVSANFIHSSMSRSRSKRQVVILDSCFSGAFAEGLSAKDDGSVDIRQQLGGEGRAVLTSSSSTQYSFEQAGEELSLYTRFLIEGIKTGDADLDEDDFISVDELHEYARRKVQEVKPEVKPELYAVREGFKIRLLSAPQGDPHQKYRKEVARCGQRGELTIVSRSILDAWRVKLGLSLDDAKEIEDGILEPYRKEFQRQLQKYEQVVIEVLERDEVINEYTRQELGNLRNVLELRNEDTVPIEAKISMALKNRRQSLKAYEDMLSELLRQEYPLSDVARLQLQAKQKSLALTQVDVVSIEEKATEDAKAYRRNLHQYENAFFAATQHGYPLNKANRSELRQLQKSLGLTDIEIAPTESKVTTQIETYQQKLQQYEDAFSSATQFRYKLNKATLNQLKQTRQNLGLNNRDVEKIEAPILAQIETYQSNLHQYEQEFSNATKQRYPLDGEILHELRQRQRDLNLNNNDVSLIENKINTLIQEYRDKSQQYEKVFADSIRYEFPPSEASRRELKRFQDALELLDKDIEKIESRIVLKKEYNKGNNKLSFFQAIGGIFKDMEQPLDLRKVFPTPAEASYEEERQTPALKSHRTSWSDDPWLEIDYRLEVEEWEE